MPSPDLVKLFDHEPRVIVVDDDREVGLMTCDMLATMGLAKAFADNAAVALQKLKEECFDVVISDIVMPGESGIDLLRRVRAIGLDPGFVFLTGHGAVELVVEAVRLGALDFLLKPFTLEEISDATRRALELTAREQRARALLDELGAVAPQTKDLLEDLRRQSGLLRAVGALRRVP